jgi:hypothetical protein
MLKQLVFAAVLTFCFASEIWCQSPALQGVFPEANDRALAGVKVVDARVVIGTWLEMTEDRDRLRSNAQSAFELGLRRDGVVVESSAPNYLHCRVSFAEAEGIVVYAYNVEYFEFATTGAHRLLWRSSGIVSVGRGNFSAAEVANYCSDSFGNAWLKWNPRP